MKAKLILLTLLIQISIICKSQDSTKITKVKYPTLDYTNNIKLGFGTSSFLDNVLAVGYAINNIFDDNNTYIDSSREYYYDEILSFYPNISINYSNKISKKMTYGASLTWGMFVNNYNVDLLGNTYKQNNVTNKFIFMPNLYFHYLHKKNFEMYSGLEFGIAIFAINNKRIDVKTNRKATLDKYSEVIPFINICPVGVRLKRKFSPYLQLNLGSRGIIEAGMSYRFEQKKENVII